MIWALDLSMERTGICIFDNKTLKPIYKTSILTNKKHTHGKRLYQIAKEIYEIKKDYPPTEIAIERTFNRFNTATAVLYKVHGLINYLFHDIEQTYYSPKTIKECIVSGNASKELVRLKIEEEIPDISFDNEDESDACAIGITHLVKTKRLNWKKGIPQKIKSRKKKSSNDV